MQQQRPTCDVDGCEEEPTLATQEGSTFRFFCNKHREDKRLEYQRDANWRHKLKTKYGIDLGRPRP